MVGRLQYYHWCMLYQANPLALWSMLHSSQSAKGWATEHSAHYLNQFAGLRNNSVQKDVLRRGHYSWSRMCTVLTVLLNHIYRVSLKRSSCRCRHKDRQVLQFTFAGWRWWFRWWSRFCCWYHKQSLWFCEGSNQVSVSREWSHSCVWGMGWDGKSTTTCHIW